MRAMAVAGDRYRYVRAHTQTNRHTNRRVRTHTPAQSSLLVPQLLVSDAGYYVGQTGDVCYPHLDAEC